MRETIPISFFFNSNVYIFWLLDRQQHITVAGQEYKLHYIISHLNSLFSLLFFQFIFLSIVDLQCCVNFFFTAKWFIFMFIYSFPLWFITKYWLWFFVLYSRNFLFSLLYIKVASAYSRLLIHSSSSPQSLCSYEFLYVSMSVSIL